MNLDRGVSKQKAKAEPAAEAKGPVGQESGLAPVPQPPQAATMTTNVQAALVAAAPSNDLLEEFSPVGAEIAPAEDLAGAFVGGHSPAGLRNYSGKAKIEAADLPTGLALGAPNHAKNFLEALANEVTIAAYKKGNTVHALRFRGDEEDLEACVCTVDYTVRKTGKSLTAILNDFVDMDAATQDKVRYAGTTMVNGTTWANGAFDIEITLG